MKKSRIFLIAIASCTLCLNACTKKSDNAGTSDNPQQNDSVYQPLIANSIIPPDERIKLTDSLTKEIVNCQMDNVKKSDDDENFHSCNEETIHNLIAKGAALEGLASKNADGKSPIDINQPVYEKDGHTPGEYLFWAGEYAFTEEQNRGRAWNFIKSELEESQFLAKEQISDDYRLLKYALQNHDIEMINKLLASGMDLNKKYKDGTTPIFYVAPSIGSHEQSETLKMLISKGADIHVKDDNGNTLLHQGFDAKSTKLLIDAGLDVNAQNSLGQTPLMAACIKDGNLEELLNANADVNIKDNEGKPVLGYMMEKGPENTQYKDLVKLIDAGADLAFIKTAGPDGKTYLDAYKALVTKQFNKMDDISPTELGHATYPRYAALLESDANFFNPSTSRASRMLKHALAWDYDFDDYNEPVHETSLEILKSAIKDGADLNRTYANGKFPVFLIKDVESAQILKDAGAVLTMQARDGSTLLHQTLSKPLFEFFLKAGVDPKAINLFGNTPLFYVDAKTPNSADARSIVKQLLDAGTNAKIINKNGQNALFGINDVQIVRQLIKAGANASVVDNNEETALFHATDPDVIQELLKAHADPAIINNNNETALFRATNPKSASLLACVKTINVQDVVVANCQKAMKELLESNKDKKIIEFNCAKVVNNKGQTALFTVQDPDALTVLLKAGIDINHQDNEGKTALFGASLEKQRRLIENGIDVNIQDDTGKSAIFYVALEDVVEMEKGRWYDPNLTALEELVKAGAHIDITDKDGNNIYQLCREKNCHNQETADKLKAMMEK